MTYSLSRTNTENPSRVLHFDFNRGRRIGEGMLESDPQLAQCGGYDHERRMSRRRRLLLVLHASILLASWFAGAPPAPSAAPLPSQSSTGSWDAPSAPYGRAALSEGGWLLFSGALRTTSNPTPSSLAKDGPQNGAMRARRIALGAVQLTTLAVRTHLEAVKTGRIGSRSTAIPPPAA